MCCLSPSTYCTKNCIIAYVCRPVFCFIVNSWCTELCFSSSACLGHSICMQSFLIEMDWYRLGTLAYMVFVRQRKVMHFLFFFPFFQIWATIIFRENILVESIQLISSTWKSLLPFLPLLNSYCVILSNCQILECVHFCNCSKFISILFKYRNWKMGNTWRFQFILLFIFISDNFIMVSLTWRTNNSKNIK